MFDYAFLILLLPFLSFLLLGLLGMKMPKKRCRYHRHLRFGGALWP